ncbi:TonB-dependent receptor [Fulvivirgaceae bacterium PWU4]|uniref:TonB-dependent receptor n=1 Tax=Chryseosolibacter histidini TaxID=2782349 RepID=A0AAP2GHF2_9BACT|nr:TonB-dependent receptor [Chryseosolibacter histidini]MBT1696009.1 TonB-dependent receptor [Chryseosolibacter histidini]
MKRLLHPLHSLSFTRKYQFAARKSYAVFFVFVSFHSFAQQGSQNNDSLSARVLQEIVVTASRSQESLLRAPVSIETMSLQAIRQSAHFSFFDAIQNLKGIQVLTPSMGFKVINARGFANTTNVRFVQMVDGLDNQAPHIGAPVANTLGPNDLDILSVEVVPGSASAVYGMNAINGLANFVTKDPFQYQGLSINQKTGFNNVKSPETNATIISETNLRFAKAINDRWAFKINGTFMKGTDWFANNRTDLNPAANVSTGLTGDLNPGSDHVNVYADESANRRTLTLGGKQYVVSRTGYAEMDVASYGIQNLKGDVSLFFRPNEKLEVSYTYRAAHQNNIYQRTNRFRFGNYRTQQHALQFKSASIQFRAYLTQENTGDSYNIRSMAENIDRTFKSDNAWFSDFTNRFNSGTSGGMSVADAMHAARAFADNGRYVPHTAQMHHLIDSLRDINNWDYGAALRVKANLAHSEFQHDITHLLFDKNSRVTFMYGLDFREYIIVPDGNYFINPEETGDNLNYWKVGGFVQSSVSLLNDKVKVNGVVRIDKNQYFDPKINPRLAIVYSPTPLHNIRVSAQNGYRFPSIFEAFSNINSGGRKRVGGLPIMSNGIFENSYTQASITAFQRAVQTDVNTSGMTLNDAIQKEEGLLKQNPYTYLQPEHVTSFEAGYRAALFNERLKLDMDFYYNTYRNLMAQIDANIPKRQHPDSIGYYLQSNSRQNLYRLWTNSKTISYNYGASFGASYDVSKKLRIGGNFTYAKLSRKDQSDGLEDGFNTPEWTYNLSVASPNFYKTIGFNINFRQQPPYLWQSALATGNVDGYATLDLQLTADLLENTLLLKLGSTNLTNKYYYSFIGGPAIGGFYYIAATFSM